MTEPADDERQGARRPRLPVVAFIVSIVAALGLAVVYWPAANRRARACCWPSPSAASASAWSRGPTASCPTGPTRSRGSTVASSPRRQLAALDADLMASEEEIGRRRLLVRLLAGAGGALGVAALFPIRSLGPRPGRGPASQPVRDRATHLVTEQGDAGPARRPRRRRRSSPSSPRATRTTPTADAPDPHPPGAEPTPAGPGGLGGRGPGRLLEDLHPRRLPGRPVPGRAAGCCCAPATSPPSTSATAAARCSAPPPARCPSSPSPSTTTAT